MTEQTWWENADRRHSLSRVSELGRSSAFLKIIEDLMTKRILSAALVAATTGVYCTSIVAADLSARKNSVIDQIENVVVIYAENRSFDNLYGFFPGANG